MMSTSTLSSTYHIEMNFMKLLKSSSTVSDKVRSSLEVKRLKKNQLLIDSDAKYWKVSIFSWHSEKVLYFYQVQFTNPYLK